MLPGELWRRLAFLFNRSRHERELEEEMAAHRAMMGDPRAFGNPLKLREESRDAWGWRWLDLAGQDLRHGARVLWRAPGFAIAAVLILSAGTGLNLGLFHLLNVMELQPLPVRDPHRLVHFERRGPTFASSGVPYPATQFVRHHNTVLSAVLTEHRTEVAWGADGSDRVQASFVSANWFEELGHGPALGRVFAERLDEKPDAPPAVVVSHQLWRTRLGSAPDTVGRAIRLNDRTATVVGVAARDFPGLEGSDPHLWLLIHQIDHFDPGTAFKDAWDTNNTDFYARLQPGVSPAAAKEGLGSTLRELAQAHPQHFQDDEWLEPATGSDRFRHRRDRQELWTVAAQVGGLTLLVLIVACANLSNLVLSHAIGRLREFSVRTALGASRWRVMCQLVVESTLLTAFGAIGGLALGVWSARLFASRAEMPDYLDLSPDWRLFAATLAVAFVAMLAVGLVPAWMVTRRDLTAAIKDGGQQTSAGLARARYRLVLVAAQVAGCCALLVVATAMVHGLQRILALDPGFRLEGVALLDPALGRHDIRGEAARAYWSEVTRTLAAHPDVERLALAYPAPLGGAVLESIYASAPDVRVSTLRVEPAFFQLMEIPFLAGRSYTTADDPEAVVVISRRLAIALYGTLDVLGREFEKGRTIVGVSADAPVVRLRGANLAEQYSPPGPAEYGDLVLVARGRGNPQALLAPMRAAARAADSRVLPATRLLREQFEASLRAPRLASLIAGLVALLVLTLACIGIFGVVAYAVALRTKEIGIRRALGADGVRVVTLLIRNLAWPVGLGMLLGTGAGVLAGRLLAGAPFHLASINPSAPAAALAIFSIVGLAAALLPASRALSGDPLQALRHEE